MIDAYDVSGRINRKVAECGSQQEFAVRAGVSPQHVSEVLKGNKRPGPRLLRAVGLERVVVTSYREVHGSNV